MANKKMGLGIPAMILVFAMTAVGCVSTGTYDASLPESQQATLIVTWNTPSITLFNGEQVNWRPPFALFAPMASYRATIPAGRHTLSNGFSPPIEFEFEAGKTYRVTQSNNVLSIEER